MCPAAPPKSRPRSASRRPPGPGPNPQAVSQPQEGPRRRYRMSREQYLEFQEVRTDVKFEWVDGEAIEMAGGTEQHASVGGNIYGLLWTAMRRRHGKAYNSELRTRTGAGTSRYPDSSVVLGESRFVRHPEDKRLDLLNPTVVVEVLSESTADTDEREKLVEYASSESVTDYILADSREMRVVHRTRTGPEAAWDAVTLTDPADVLALPAVGFSATLAEIYEGVDLP